jgi:MFS family permease
VGLLTLSVLVLPAFLVVRSFAGLFSAPIYPAAARSVSFWMPGEMRVLANGLVIGAALLGNASTYFVFGGLMNGYGWPVAFAIAGLATALLAMAWTLVARDRPPSSDPRSRRREVEVKGSGLPEPLVDPPPGGFAGLWHAVLRNKPLLWLTLSYAAVGYFEYVFYFWMQYYFRDVLELGDRSRLYSTIASLSMAAGMFAGGPAAAVVRRSWPGTGPSVVPAGAMVASALLLVLGITATEPVWVLVWFSLSLACIGATEGPLWTMAVALGRERGGTSAAIFNTGGNAGGVLGPVVTPLFAVYFGWRGGLLLAGVICVVGAVLCLWVDPEEKADRPHGS